MEERFVIESRLGEGGMGVVFRAFDRVRRQPVALKALRTIDPQRLYRFKQEFRALADIVHPNLVTLYELHAVAERWAFSMELLDAVDFLQHVRPYHVEPTSEDEPTATVNADVNTTEPPARQVAVARQRIAAAPLQPARLRDAMVQLVAGIRAIHAAGKLHCDLKPSNVLVERGRVVVCDFGLVTDPTATLRPAEALTAGTPAYMSPEQARGAPLTEASDWYSVGVMLYEALSGVRPFEGSPAEVRERKQREDPATPRWSPDADPALCELAMALVARSPAARPSGEEIERKIGGRGTARMAQDRALFIGRGTQLAELEAAFAASRQEPVAVFVHGRSGIGKTATVRAFLAGAPAREHALVLEGRCYERESVPYKTLDAVIDALTRALVARRDAHVTLPPAPDLASLVRLFPVLRRVTAIEAATRDVALPHDPQELRERAVAALRVLLADLAAREPVVVFVDDLQWGDVDSMPFLTTLLLHPNAPHLLFVATYRDEDVDTSPVLRALRGIAGIRELSVDALSSTEATELAGALLANRATSADEARRIAQDAVGNPFLVAELALASALGPSEAAVPTLDQALLRRVDALPEDAKALVTLACVAGRPLPIALLSDAAAISDEAAALAAVRPQRLLRTGRLGDREVLEPYHDRIREAVTRRLPADAARDAHRRLAMTLDAAGYDNPMALLEHWLGAGDRARASAAALAAAAQAANALAFARAAQHYAIALDLLEEGDERRHELQVKRAQALVYAGDLAEAAKLFEQASRGAERREGIDLRRRALEAYLCGGMVDTGTALAREVLADVGERLPSSAIAAMLSVVRSRFRLALRGLRFTPRDPSTIDPDVLDRVDACAAVATGMSFVNTVFGTAVQMRQVLHALDAGEPRRATIALILECGFRSVFGPNPKLFALMERSGELAIAQGPAVVGYWRAVRGLAHFLFGRFTIALDDLTRSHTEMLEHDVIYRWQADIAQIFRVGSLLYLGRTRELCELMPVLVRDATQRGNAFLAMGLKTWRGNMMWLIRDEPDEARAHMEAIAPITAATDQFHLFHFFELMSQTQIDLYTGASTAAWERVERAWPRLRASTMLRMEWMRVEAGFLRGRAALAVARDEPARRRPMLRVARRMAALARRGAPAWGIAKSHLLLALADEIAGDRDGAVLRFRAAATAFDGVDMALFAAVARLREGRCVGGTDGEALVAGAQALLRAEAVVRPDALAAVYAPA